MIYFTHDLLGRLDIGPPSIGGGCGEHGYVVTGFQVGFPTVREVARNRSLSDGSVDDTRFVGPRAITANVTIDQNKADPQLIADRLAQYVSPRYRPRLHWIIPGSTQERSAIVRGTDAPLVIAGPKYHTVVASWVAPDGLLEAGTERCETINPSGDTEAGRVYDLVFDRAYPPSLGLGDRIVTNDGNAPADWIATIYGEATNPSLSINGVAMTFDRNGGLALTGGTSLVINTRERTILLNGDPAESRYQYVNFTDWTWDQLRLQPGENLLRYEALVLGAGTQVVICWRSSWL